MGKVEVWKVIAVDLPSSTTGRNQLRGWQHKRTLYLQKGKNNGKIISIQLFQKGEEALIIVKYGKMGDFGSLWAGESSHPIFQLFLKLRNNAHLIFKRQGLVIAPKPKGISLKKGDKEKLRQFFHLESLVSFYFKWVIYRLLWLVSSSFFRLRNRASLQRSPSSAHTQRVQTASS